jgi:hypothetical protein
MKIQILLLMLTAAALSAESKDDAEIRSAIKALQQATNAATGLSFTNTNLNRIKSELLHNSRQLHNSRRSDCRICTIPCDV